MAPGEFGVRISRQFYPSGVVIHCGSALFFVAMQHPNRELIALTIQQPWAELILRGIKTIEVRSVPASNNVRIYLYASRKHSTFPFAFEAIEKHAINVANLPTGQVVGTVTISHSRQSVEQDEAASCVPWSVLRGKFSWELKNPQRLDPPLPPNFLPYGMWFYPFQRRNPGQRKKRRNDDPAV